MSVRERFNERRRKIVFFFFFSLSHGILRRALRYTRATIIIRRTQVLIINSSDTLRGVIYRLSAFRRACTLVSFQRSRCDTIIACSLDRSAAITRKSNGYPTRTKTDPSDKLYDHPWFLATLFSFFHSFTARFSRFPSALVTPRSLYQLDRSENDGSTGP